MVKNFYKQTFTKLKKTITQNDNLENIETYTAEGNFKGRINQVKEYYKIISNKEKHQATHKLFTDEKIDKNYRIQDSDGETYYIEERKDPLNCKNLWIKKGLAHYKYYLRVL